MNIELDGVNDLDQRLQRLAASIDNATDRALADSANHLLGEAVSLAPVDTGDLRGSGNLQAIKNGYEVRFNQRYAAVQHERLDYNHPRGGQAKYLEQPLEENRQRYLQHLRDSVRREIT